MELEDLRAKWTEIQQTKLSKESRQVLRSAASIAEDHSSSVTVSYLQLDNSSKSANAYLNQRKDELDAKLSELVSASYMVPSNGLKNSKPKGWLGSYSFSNSLLQLSTTLFKNGRRRSAKSKTTRISDFCLRWNIWQ